MSQDITIDLSCGGEDACEGTCGRRECGGGSCAIWSSCIPSSAIADGTISDLRASLGGTRLEYGGLVIEAYEGEMCKGSPAADDDGCSTYLVAGPGHSLKALCLYP